MNFVTTRQSLSKLNFALAAPKFFYLFDYFIILAISHAAGRKLSLNQSFLSVCDFPDLLCDDLCRVPERHLAGVLSQ